MRNFIKLYVVFFSMIVTVAAGTFNCTAQTTPPATDQTVPQASAQTAPPVAVQIKKKHPHHSLRDSLRRKMLQRDSLIRSFRSISGSANVLLGKIEDYTSAYVETSADLNHGFDTLDMSQRLPVLERRMALMRNAISNSTTLGNLVTFRDLIDHLKEDLGSWEDQLTEYSDQLDNIHNQVADFNADTVLRTVPADSTLREQCFNQVQALDAKWKALDKTSEKALIRIGLLQNRVSKLSILLIDLDDRIDLKIHDFTLKALTNENGFIWDLSAQRKLNNIDSALVNTYSLNVKLYHYFFTNKSNDFGHWGSLALFVVFLCWVWFNRSKIKKDNNASKTIFDQTHYIVRHPILSTVLMISLLSPYLYDHPVQIFWHTTLLVMMGAAGVLIKVNWPKSLFKFWVLIFIAAVIFCISGLMVITTYADRIALLLLCGVLIYFSYKLLNSLKIEKQEYPPYLPLILKVFIGLNALSMVLNITGRFSLAKIVGVTATINLCEAAGLYLLVQILMESLFLQSETGKNADQSRLTARIDFNQLQKKFKDVLIKIGLILWLVALARNLTIDDYLYDQANDFLNHPYKFSSTAFTFRSVLVFVAVIWLSGLLARVISYFYDFADRQTKLTPQAKKTRSSILLIRLTVFIIGFFVAINAAGIPMDRVTIVIGALGVGIGFGLQNIVNNLVSGVILAIEKPIQVGDIIEVSGKSGTIKEIGIRSSKIDCGDGSELIVPNGDLISQHVVNWTLTNNNRRVELLIKVAYGSDVPKVEGLLSAIVVNHKDVMDSPAPSVRINNFSDSAIEFRVLFWAADISGWLALKSDVMREIYAAFAKEGIEVPQGQLQVLFPENRGKSLAPGAAEAPKGGKDDAPDGISG